MCALMVMATGAHAQGFGQIYRDGQLVATVQPDGWIVSTQGAGFIAQVSSRGELLRRGQVVARFEPMGMVVSAEGRLLGQIDGGGYVYRAGQAVGQIDDQGWVYESGRQVGQGMNVPRLTLVAYFFFLTDAAAPDAR